MYKFWINTVVQLKWTPEPNDSCIKKCSAPLDKEAPFTMFDSKEYLSSIYIIPFIFQVVNYQDHRDFILQNSMYLREPQILL